MAVCFGTQQESNADTAFVTTRAREPRKKQDPNVNVNMCGRTKMGTKQFMTCHKKQYSCLYCQSDVELMCASKRKHVVQLAQQRTEIKKMKKKTRTLYRGHDSPKRSVFCDQECSLRLLCHTLIHILPRIRHLRHGSCGSDQCTCQWIAVGTLPPNDSSLRLRGCQSHIVIGVKMLTCSSCLSSFMYLM